MSVDLELARAGIVIKDNEIIFTKAVTIEQDTVIEGSVSVTNDITLANNLLLGGVLRTPVRGKYLLESPLLDVSGTNAVYAVVPTDGAGELTALRYYLTVALTTADAILTLSVDGNAISATATVTQAGSAIGDSSTQALPAGLENNTVAAGSYIKILSNGGPDAGSIKCCVEITKR